MKTKILLPLVLSLYFTINLQAQIIPELEIQPQGLEFLSDQGQSFYIQRDSNSLMIGNDSVPNLLDIRFADNDSIILEIQGNLSVSGELISGDSIALIIIADDLIGIRYRDSIMLEMDSIGPIMRTATIRSHNSGRSDNDHIIAPGSEEEGTLNFFRGDTLLASIGTATGVHSENGFHLCDSISIRPLLGEGLAVSSGNDDIMRFYKNGDSIGVQTPNVKIGDINQTHFDFIYSAPNGQGLGISCQEDPNSPLIPTATIGLQGIRTYQDLLFNDSMSIRSLPNQGLAIMNNDSIILEVRKQEQDIVISDLTINGITTFDIDARWSQSDSMRICGIENAGLAIIHKDAGAMFIDSVGPVASDLTFFSKTNINNMNSSRSGQESRIRLGGSNDELLQLMRGDTIILEAGTNGTGFDVFGTERMRLDSNTLHLDPPGMGNTFVGLDAGKNNTPSSFLAIDNTAVGENAFFSNTIGRRNAALGSYALQGNTIGNSNTAMGHNALATNTEGDVNLALGEFALYNNLTGDFNTAVGAQTMALNETGDLNTAAGYNALAHNTTGFLNTAIGAQADVVSGNLSNATAIGAHAEVATSNSLVLGGTGSWTVNVGIGTDSPTEELHVVGNICYTGTSATCSDRRYKQHLQPITGALSKLAQLNGLYYDWRREDFPKMKFSADRQIGVIAQEVEVHFPEVVTTNPEGYKSVDYSRLTPVLLEAVKELAAQSEQQQSEIGQLRDQNEALQRQLDEVAELRSMVVELKAVMGNRSDGEE